MTNTAAANGGTVTYSFVASDPGTFLYESGTNPEKQVRMGLFGALIVRPTMGADFAYNRADSEFTTSEEFMVLLSEIDPYQHQAVEQGRTFNMNNYHPRYWLINGRGFPDSIADNFASWLPTQPYGALAEVTEFNAATHPLPGHRPLPERRHRGLPVPPARQQRPGDRPRRPPAGRRRRPGPVVREVRHQHRPGQTWDVLFNWYDAEDYARRNPVPVTVPGLANQEIGMFYSGSPYLGETETLPPGIQTLNQCGEYYIIAHNHALFQITSWGANMTGPITYTRIDPPDPTVR